MIRTIIAKGTNQKIIEFLDYLLGKNLRWALSETSRSILCTTISPEDGLVITFSLITPRINRYQLKSYSNTHLVDLPDNGRFDQKKHWHFYRVSVEDPSYRWGKKGILRFEAMPVNDQTLYGYAKRQHDALKKRAVLVGEARSFATAISFIEQAMSELMFPSGGGIPSRQKRDKQ